MKVLPASAGMIPDHAQVRAETDGAPRKRGDDPADAMKLRYGTECSPQARG